MAMSIAAAATAVQNTIALIVNRGPIAESHEVGCFSGQVIVADFAINYVPKTNQTKAPSSDKSQGFALRFSYSIPGFAQVIEVWNPFILEGWCPSGCG